MKGCAGRAIRAGKTGRSGLGRQRKGKRAGRQRFGQVGKRVSKPGCGGVVQAAQGARWLGGLEERIRGLGQEWGAKRAKA